MTQVFNLATQEERSYSCSPRESVIAAYAQERNDWNTWDYGKKYGGLVEEGKLHFLCGDWAGRKPERP